MPTPPASEPLPSPQSSSQLPLMHSAGADASAASSSEGVTENVAPEAIAEPPGRTSLAELLGSWDGEATAAARSNSAQPRRDSQLAMVRLGIATSLYEALRIRHAPTAAHGLRVALVCSAWAERLGLRDDDRDRVEVAALLHDVGKIGIPDRILRKPGKLTVDEQLTMAACPRLSCEILAGCTDDTELLNIVRYAGAWYEGRRSDDTPRGDALPLGSRVLAIAEAFDAMTTDHVYRPAMSRERAIEEILRGSGTQFDPELALDYCRMLEQRPELLQGCVVDRWLRQLDAGPGAAFWRAGGKTSATSKAFSCDQLFFAELSDRLHDGVAFTDTEGTVSHWNAAMERLTAIKADAIVGQSWGANVVRLTAADDREGGESDREDLCPVAECLRHGNVVSRTMRLRRVGADSLPVHVQVSAVSGPVPGLHGAVVVIRDLSDRANLEQRLASLHRRATRDPLTGVANRAEFDRALVEATEQACSGGQTVSLVICDIDHFKRINDMHGHPAGDAALIQFAGILQRHSREGDVVARYGGEEFVLLAADCDNATATRRAERIRKTVEQTPLECLGGQPITASFGVTEYQTGDSAETILARADRALLRAKDNGRNRVIQLGSGKQAVETEPAAHRGWWNWLERGGKYRRYKCEILTPVPIELAVEKLRGFIADHNAEILSVNESQLSLRVQAGVTRSGRRMSDRQIAMQVDLTLSEQLSGKPGQSAYRRSRQTKVHANLTPIRPRDRRRRELKHSTSQVVASLRSYLMGSLVSSEVAE